MTADEHAAYERRANRACVRRAGGLWWRRVRPLFYRPLFLFRDLPATAAGPLSSRLLGAAQFPVAPGSGNSTLGLLISDELNDYSLSRLTANARNQVRKGLKTFTLKVLTDREEFVRLGHPVFCEFLDRTQYQVNQARRTIPGFAAWAGELFALPKLRLTGAFLGEALAAVSVTFRVEDIVFYSVYFGNQAALKGGASDLMIHHVRELAREAGDVRLIFAAVAGMPRGLDRFYLLRGFRCLPVPTRLTGNPLTLGGLRCVAPQLYRRMTGQALLEEMEGGSMGGSIAETS